MVVGPEREIGPARAQDGAMNRAVRSDSINL
jgi:hypothetical protein